MSNFNKVKLEYLKKKHKHFPSPVREWNNSIYAYNKNTLSSIPVTTNSVMKMIRNYFNLFNKSLERKMRTKRLLLRFRRNSSNRIYLSNGEFKHTNDKVLINIYLYNRQKYNYLNKLRKSYLNRILKEKGKKYRVNYLKRKNNLDRNIINSLRSIYKRKNFLLKKAKYSKYIIINILKKNSSLVTLQSKSMYRIHALKNISKSTVNFYKKSIEISMKKLLMYFFYKQLMFINKSKLNYTYLQKLKLNLERMYNKNVEFNLINLKNLFLNSDIMSEVAKLKLTRNRRRLLRVMIKLREKMKIHKKRIPLRQTNAGKTVKNLNDLRPSETNLEKFVIYNLKYKYVTGFRLEARGRLTRRHKAARAISKVRYKGNLSDIDSSHKGLSSVILKGNLKSNLQYTKSYSKTRIGAFGLKGWVSGY